MTTVRLTDSAKNELQEYALLEGISEQKIVSQAITEFIFKHCPGFYDADCVERRKKLFDDQRLVAENTLFNSQAYIVSNLYALSGFTDYNSRHRGYTMPFAFIEHQIETAKKRIECMIYPKMQAYLINDLIVLNKKWHSPEQYANFLVEQQKYRFKNHIPDDTFKNQKEWEGFGF